MATSVETPRRGAPLPPEESPAFAALLRWLGAHRRPVATGAALLAIAAGLIWWNMASRTRVEAAASQRLEQARLGFESHNYPLAASELQQVVENYAGTRAAAQAELLLAQVRLYQGQPQQTIDLLKRVAPGLGRDFSAQGFGLLGAAYENVAHPAEAAGAYEEAARRAQFAFLRAQYLADASRAWLATHDTTKALADYTIIVSGMDSTAVVAEARVRLGELTRGAGKP